MNPSEPPRSGHPKTPQFPNHTPVKPASPIHIPELDRKQAEEEQRRNAQIHAANPNAPNAQGLNSSGLPSSQEYYKKKNAPLSPSLIVPLAESRTWLLVLAIGALLLGFVWIKDAIDGLRFHSGGFSKIYYGLELTGAYFFFILPAWKLWSMKHLIDTLEIERNEASLVALLFAHALFWKYLGKAICGMVAFYLLSAFLSKVIPLLSI